jgi:glucose/mannose-6-phosphate isomerase
MGGSSLAAHITKSLYFDILDRVFEIVKDYLPPPSINPKTLVVLLNYSGETEETFSCAQIAYQKDCLLFGITTGQKLGRFLKEKNLPHYLINPTYNPSGQSRLGLPYTLFGLLGLLQKLNLVTLSEEETQGAIESLKAQAFQPIAQEVARKLVKRVPLIIGANHLAGNAHALSNQINETSKNFSTFFLLPELNHHLLEGLVNPITNPENLVFLFLNSDLYPEEIKKRARLTQEVIEKNNVPVVQFQPQATTKLGQVLECLQFSGYLSYHLAQLNQVNPAEIPWVTYFKKQMEKNP